MFPFYSWHFTLGMHQLDIAPFYFHPLLFTTLIAISQNNARGYCIFSSLETHFEFLSQIAMTDGWMWNINEASAEDKTKNRYIQELTLRFIASDVLGLFALHTLLILEELSHRSEFRRSVICGKNARMKRIDANKRSPKQNDWTKCAKWTGQCKWRKNKICDRRRNWFLNRH